MARKTECPFCMAQSTTVSSTRYTKKMRLVKRYCLCGDCGHNFITVEIGYKQYQELKAVESLLNLIWGIRLSTSGNKALLLLPVFKSLTSIVKGKEK